MPPNLTPRQLEIFNLISKGLTNKEICRLLGISNNTVKIHVASILRNLGVANRTEAVFAYQELLEENNANPATNARLQLVDRLGRPSIAVLPFEDLQDTDDDEHLMQGLVEELLVRLSTWQWFPVIAYGSSRRFDPKTHNPQELGAELAARYLIYGSVRRNNTEVRVTVRLVDTDLNQEIWSRRFDALFVDLFDLQDQIATQVVSVMAPELVEAEAQHVEPKNIDTSSAWECVCRGMWLLNRHEKSSCEQALAQFDMAIKTASDFSLGWHGKVCALQQQLFEQWCDDPQQVMAQISQNAEQCYKLAPQTAHALTNMGLVKILNGQQNAALDYLEQAAQINPSSTRAISTLGEAYGMVGRLDDCIMQMEDLIHLDPHAPSAARCRTIIGMCHVMAGRTDEGIEWSQDAIARDPHAQGAYLALIAAYVEKQNMAMAKSSIAEMMNNNPGFVPAHRIAMMRPFTTPDLLARLVNNLKQAGLEVD